MLSSFLSDPDIANHRQTLTVLCEILCKRKTIIIKHRIKCGSTVCSSMVGIMS